MSEGGDPGGDYELNSHRAHLAAYFLIAGLILELVNAIIWYRGSETLAEMAAVLLIVGGVWGEVFFANRARLAGDKQLAEYQARAAEANQKAQEDALELARFRRPRVKLLTPENRQKLRAALAPFQGTRFVVGHDDLDREVWDFLSEFGPLMKNSGWVHEDWMGGRRFRKGSSLEGKYYGVANAMNVSIELMPQDEAQLRPAAEALATILTEIGTDAVIAPANNTHIAEGSIQFLVGPKR
jgi:hypothetical protein